MSSLPVVPPRPSRATAASPPAASTSPAPPTVPARPVRNRSKSPLPQSDAAADSSEGGVKLDTSIPPASSDRSSSPEQKRKIDPDLDLHHPMAVRPPGEMPKDDHIPEIGQRVPMLDFAGDVQAPSPFPPTSDSRSASRAKRRSQHTPNLPPENGPTVVGDYGAYPSSGKVYRQTGAYSLSHDDLTKSVMHANGAGVATTPGLEGVPDEEIGFAVADEIASRNVTPQVTPGAATGQKLPSKSPLATAVSVTGENDTAHQPPNLDDDGNDNHGIYGKEGPSNVSSTSLTMPTSGRHTPWEDFQDEHADGTPILASDEAGKYPVWNPPAISPKLTGAEIRRPPSSNRSRASPTMAAEEVSDPPSPIKEHVPLFPEGAAPPPKMPQRPKLGEKKHSSHAFPSKDIWEDAPESTHVTYEVQEEEQSHDPDYYDPREARKREEEAAKAASSEPSKDAAAPPPPPARPVKATAAEASSPISPDTAKAAPSVPERPKPAIPPRPAKKVSEPSSATTEGSTSPEEARSPPPTKPKPIIPGRVGGGIAALRANFMSDLNSRLSKGPVAPKKEEVSPEAEPEPKPQEPLEDVRKTRARGPAKRKPTAAAAASTAAPAPASPVSPPKLTFSSIITVYSIGDDYEVTFDETKFDDEPSKVARPIGEKVLEELKGGEDGDTSKTVTAVDTSAAIASEAEEPVKEAPAPVTEEKTEEKPVEVQEEKEVPVAPVEEEVAGPVDTVAETVKDVAAKVAEAIPPAIASGDKVEEGESKLDAAVEEKTAVA
ncbi:hypothetical protein TWF696_006858 [Orbilia brochopaga]|uniref:Altered inheritance of mitochondria protein 21 n=1 Tax=Orbilia brochopaga TaxID=3140254 RepID=A0AAV9UTF0_9PEZI